MSSARLVVANREPSLGTGPTAHGPRLAYLRYPGRPTYLLFDTGFGERADFEVATPRSPLPDFVPDDGRRRLHEDDRLRRHHGARFGGMVGVIQPDADELACPRHARPDARVAFHQRERLQIDLGQRRQRIRIEHTAREIADMA